MIRGEYGFDWQANHDQREIFVSREKGPGNETGGLEAEARAGGRTVVENGE